MTKVPGPVARAATVAISICIFAAAFPVAAEPEETTVEDAAAEAADTADPPPTIAAPPAGASSSAPPRPDDDIREETADGPAQLTPDSGASGPAGEQETPPTLTIATWGGAYGRSQELAYVDPFRSETGTKVTLVTHGGRAGAIGRLAKDGGANWDLVDLGSYMLTTACDAGYLEVIDFAALLTKGKNGAAADDFLPGALHKCGVASMAWSSVIAFDTRAFKKRKPSKLEDFFDVKRFSGTRGLRDSPKYALELALMADGVAPDDVYDVLATPAGVGRAFAMLDKIKDSILWWTRGDEPLARLASRDVTMTTAFNGRIFNSVVTRNVPLEIVWDGQVYDTDHWAIPKSAANKAAARAFIAFALEPDRLAAQARLLPYGPMRRSAIALVAKHAEADVDLHPFIPTTKKNFRSALKLDDAWWETHGPELTRRFEAWRTAPPEATAE